MITIVDGYSTNKRFYFNEVYLGYAYKEVDGFYVFVFPKDMEGSWTDYSLRMIADRLTELNKEWSEYVNVNLKP